MGYKRRTLKLVFEDESFEGLEVRVRPMSIGQLLEAGRLDGGDAGETHAQRLDRFLPYLAEALIDWNLEEDDGTPVPSTVDGLRSLDLSFLAALIEAWANAAAGVSRPLVPSSSGGPPSEEVSLPMEPLLPSPSS